MSSTSIKIEPATPLEEEQLIRQIRKLIELKKLNVELVDRRDTMLDIPDDPHILCPVVF